MSLRAPPRRQACALGIPSVAASAPRSRAYATRSPSSRLTARKGCTWICAKVLAFEPRRDGPRATALRLGFDRHAPDAKEAAELSKDTPRVRRGRSLKEHARAGGARVPRQILRDRAQRAGLCFGRFVATRFRHGHHFRIGDGRGRLLFLLLGLGRPGWGKVGPLRDLRHHVGARVVLRELDGRFTQTSLASVVPSTATRAQNANPSGTGPPSNVGTGSFRFAHHSRSTTLAGLCRRRQQIVGQLVGRGLRLRHVRVVVRRPAHRRGGYHATNARPRRAGRTS
jgi:hypothetical protein